MEGRRSKISPNSTCSLFDLARFMKPNFIVFLSPCRSALEERKRGGGGGKAREEGKRNGDGGVLGSQKSVAEEEIAVRRL